MNNDRTFFWRKLHSISGLIPIGVFLFVHFGINYTAFYGEEAFNNAAAFMGNLPFRYAMELFIIFIPLLFHGIYGIVIARDAKNNLTTYRYEKNLYFYFQRLSGIVVFLFLIWHVGTTRVPAAFGAEVNFDMVANLVENPLYLIFYIVGILMTTFHFSNGFRTMLITWGITANQKSQQFGKMLGILLFLVLSGIGLTAIFAFV
ncbi:succinate dehydrogenase [Salisediminibacterium halotolerans]|uniref:succinate dehydrogenase n=1 Tax=Salisediminibacterium halotolerans TaxID=517425 RepID=UPI000EAFA818|nr:succinate dehydrogenase [Salisediminibacterium halotolerans]RLJ72226.1 succinate dehydrogenase subunit C [Actinophytocola xinjiangensis]RPE85439.1 succinate dehydrogenase subunit C [Salisediminibacterium halotolerans]TWG33396.1 succinate dehydrogenase subunit C [Salisediminibacterium halotolerans]GEL07882.1 succinate dehydrogenase cytochrome b558 subunit [Salisediminibacterium halotolerans]